MSVYNKRNAFAESARLHRARREQELAERDGALHVADLALDAALKQIVRSLFAVTRGRPDAAKQIAEAATLVRGARNVLRRYFDGREQEDKA